VENDLIFSENEKNADSRNIFSQLAGGYERRIICVTKILKEN
jgi:hypothetical protein